MSSATVEFGAGGDTASASRQALALSQVSLKGFGLQAVQAKLVELAEKPIEILEHAIPSVA